MRMTSVVFLVGAVALASARDASASASQEFLRIEQLVKSSKIIQVLDRSPRPRSGSVDFLVLAQPRRYGPRLMLARTGVLWIALPRQRSRKVAVAPEVAKHRFNHEAVRQGIAAARKRPRIFVDRRTKADLPPGRSARRPGAKGAGYELRYNGRLVSGSDAASYSLKQAKANCAVSRGRYPKVTVGCRHNGVPFGLGYELRYNGRLVSGPDAASYSLKQAQANCAGNRKRYPKVKVHCRFNGAPL